MNIVELIKSGDKEIFTEVYNEYHSKLYFYILAKSRSEWLAEEAVQITFIKLWDNRQNLKEEFSISSHLFKIATTTFIDLLRKKANLSEMIQILSNDEKREINISDQMDLKEISDIIYKMIKKMPPVRRKVFEMSRYEGMSHSEIAHLLNISAKTVENHITLALRDIRKKFPQIAGILISLVKISTQIGGLLVINVISICFT